MISVDVAFRIVYLVHMNLLNLLFMNQLIVDVIVM